jgi:hypothetical protein
MSAVTEQTISAWSAKGLRHPGIEPGMTKLSPAASSTSSTSITRYARPCTTVPTNRLSLARNCVASGWPSSVFSVPTMRNSRNDKPCSGGRATTSPARTPDSSPSRGHPLLAPDLDRHRRVRPHRARRRDTISDQHRPSTPVHAGDDRRPSLSAETIPGLSFTLAASQGIVPVRSSNPTGANHKEHHADRIRRTG